MDADIRLSLQKKPYSSVTVAIENLTGEDYEEDDLSGIPELVESIRLQSTGPTEAARAIRKKLKYGNVHRQLRALAILDGLILNAGSQFQRTFADEMLLERLRVCGASELTDPLVRNKCKRLFKNWSIDYKNKRGLEKIAALYQVLAPGICHRRETDRKNQELPRRTKVVTQERSKVLRETEQNPFEGEDEEDKPTPTSSRPTSYAKPDNNFKSSTPPSSSDPFKFLSSKSKKDKEKDKKSGKKKSKPFNLEEEKEAMKTCIAESSVASTNLLNALKLINREKERISENQNAVHHFDFCKLLRRKILRYVSTA
jgi:LAS seventeen-binding protein 5